MYICITNSISRTYKIHHMWAGKIKFDLRQQFYILKYKKNIYIYFKAVPECIAEGVKECKTNCVTPDCRQ